MSTSTALQRLGPTILRHLLAYSELWCEETGDALRQWRRSTLGLLGAAACGLLAVMLGCTWVIAAAWDGPRRLVVIGALCIGFALLAVIGLLYARRGRAPAYARLRGEWQQDRAVLAQLEPQLFGPPAAPEPGTVNAA